MGRLVPGQAFQAAVPGGEDPFGEPQRAEILAPSLRVPSTCGDHTRSHRAIYRAAFVHRKEDSHETWGCLSREAEASNGPSRIPDLAAHSERGRQEEAALSESLRRSRISRAGRQADPKTSLYDRQRTRADRTLRTRLSEECGLHHRRDRPPAL